MVDCDGEEDCDGVVGVGSGVVCVDLGWEMQQTSEWRRVDVDVLRVGVASWCCGSATRRITLSPAVDEIMMGVEGRNVTLFVTR